MNPETRGAGLLKVSFLQVKASAGYATEWKAVVKIRTPEERAIGFVYQSESHRNTWFNSRNDGRKYTSRMRAGRDLLERRDMGIFPRG
jgi:hypothetical protein